MIRGITFTSQLTTAKDFAHFQNKFLHGKDLITRGCTVTNNGTDEIYIAAGYLVVQGRFINVVSTETITVEDVLSGTLYCRLIFEIDLNQTNTDNEFKQGKFKIISNSADYPTLTQEDIEGTGKTYQCAIAKFTKTTEGISNFVQEIENISSDDAGFAPLNHTHDDRYYTETEVDTKLSTKSDTSHTHSNYAPKESPTFTGIAKATSNTSYTTAQLRNIYATTTDLTAGTTELSNGVIALVYE